MPSIQFGCPHCGATSQIDSVMAGQETQCPGCGGAVLVPLAPPVAVGPPPIAAGPPPIAAGAPPIAMGPPPVAAGPPPFPYGGMAPLVAPPMSLPMAAPVAAAASAPPLGQRPLVAPVAAPAPIVQPAGGLAQTAAPQAPAESKRTLRKLSAEEKAQRRLRQNLIMAGFGLAVLLLALAILLRFSG